MSYFPVKVTKTTTYTMYVEADDEDQALDVAQERLEHKTADLVDYDTTDDFTIRASVENDEEYDVLETAHEAIEANLTYVVDANGDDVVNEDD
jgi:hypothetical protein